MEKYQLAEPLMQGGATGGLDEKNLWKERLRPEILEEEKQTIMNFVESEVTKKIAEIEKLLEIRGKPAKLVLVPIDADVPKQMLGLEHNSSLSYQLLNTSNRLSSAPATLNGGTKGSSELGLSSEQDDSADHPRNPVEETKTEEKPSEGTQQLRPKKKQKIEYSCWLCGVTLTSQTNLDEHFIGKKHRKKQESVQNQKPLNSDPEGASVVKENNTNGLEMKVLANGKKFLVYKKGNNSFWCNNSNCNFTCANSADMVMHLTEIEHEVFENSEEDEAVTMQ